MHTRQDMERDIFKNKSYIIVNLMKNIPVVHLALEKLQFWLNRNHFTGEHKICKIIIDLFIYNLEEQFSDAQTATLGGYLSNSKIFDHFSDPYIP